MKKISQEIIAALVLSGIATVSQARVPLSDQDLGQVRGNDGVTLMGDLRIKTDAFVYTDTDATGGSIAFNDITIRGMYVKRYDILRGLPDPSFLVTDANTSGVFVNSVAQSMQVYLGESGAVLPGSKTAQQLNQAVAAGLYNGGDVVQIAFPNADLSSNVMPTFTVKSITPGGSSASFGSLTLERVDLQGTKRWLWAH